MTGRGTLDLQAEMIPDVLDMMAEFGHDLTVVRGGSGTTFGTPSNSNTLSTSVRGLLMPASQQRRARTPAGLPVPDWVAYLPRQEDLDLGTPGWHLIHAGRAYYPSGDAEDPGGQGLVWIVPLRSPGEVTDGPSEPGWTG